MSRSAPLVAGVDGCPFGWVAVVGPAAGAELWVTVAPDISTLFSLHPSVLRWAVDIPIGLADDGPRACDSLARKRLGSKRGSSIFPSPPRAVAEYSEEQGRDASYVEACRLAAEATGKKISKQAWNITPKIAEVRRFLIDNSRWRDRVFEAHPELAFARLADGEALVDAKKTPAGGLRRRQLLSRVVGADCIERLVRQTESTRGVAVDDTLDAIACWTVAVRAASGQAESLPSDPQRDATGLLRAIVG